MEQKHLTKLLIFGTLNISAIMFSQVEADSARSRDIDEVVITGNSNPKASIKTSTSISTLKAKDIEQSAPRTTAEIFRTIPGIRAESSGGEGNSNITVRGVPVSAGGSRYLLIQEDGLPVLQFGDIAFATQDQFTRFDSFVSRVEALRGGSASVFSSNSPAGIINFITKTGEKEGGSITQQFGLNYKNYRTDFDYGTPIGENTFVSTGGFYRVGDGPRKTGFNSNNGGQFRLSFLKKFENGSFRVYTKLLDDRTAAYMPMPIGVTGSDSDPKYSSLSNYDALTGSLQTINLMHDRTLDNNGNFLTSDVSDGMHSKSKVLGAAFTYDLGDGWKLREHARYSINNGQFIAPFPASVNKGSDFFNATNFNNFGRAVYAGTNQDIDMNANYMKIALFNVKLNNFNNFMNEFVIDKKWDGIKLNAGVFKSIQNINMSWVWNNYLQEVNDTNARLIDVIDNTGNYITDRGLLNYGMSDWGNLKRDYNTKYDVTALHAQVEFTAVDNKLTVDLGARYDIGKVNGYFSGATVTNIVQDMNQNGVIDTPELSVGTNDNIIVPVNYDYGIFGYSVGANYALNSKNAVFARVSQGGSASADRILFSNYEYTNTDDKALDAVKVNTVNQTEAGYKLRGRGYFLNSTLFFASTVEANYEATTQKKTENKYESYGLELDGAYRINNNFEVKAGLTYTHAEIKNALDPTIVGNTPRRTPQMMYTVNPNYNTEKFNIGFYVVGATKAYTQDSNKLIMPGYAVVNPYVSYQVLKNLTFSVNGNNVFNTIAITEAEEGSLDGGNGIIRARSLTGSSYSVSLKLDF